MKQLTEGEMRAYLVNYVSTLSDLKLHALYLHAHDETNFKDPFVLSEEEIAIIEAEHRQYLEEIKEIVMEHNLI